MLNICLKNLMSQENLNPLLLTQGLESVMLGENSLQIAAFLSAFSAKGETVSELLSCVKFMQKIMLPLELDDEVLDIVGTGGDGLNTINISTGSALLASACGVKIAKHGNHSSSSLCGSADVLEALGFNIFLSPKEINLAIQRYGFGFCYAPQFHPAFKKIKSIRQNLGVPTLFNLIGPLLNPAKAKFLMIGVSDKKKLGLIAEVLLHLDIKHAFVFHGSGSDEISTLGTIDVIEIKNNMQKSMQLNPLDYGFKLCQLGSLRGGDKYDNAKIILEVLQGKKGAVADTFIFNAGIAAYLYGLTSDITEGIALAKIVHETGMAYDNLKKMIEVYHA